MVKAFDLSAFLGGLNIVCKSIASGQTTSLDSTSAGLLSVMQELSRRATRRESGKTITASTETDWAKKMINFAPHGQYICRVCEGPKVFCYDHSS